MREIKFRAWNGYEWIFFDLTQRGEEIHLITIEEGRFMIPRIYEIHMVNNLCQFTGLKDKTGKEIYEGNILKAQKQYPNGVVKFMTDGRTMYIVDDKIQYDGSYMYELGEFEMEIIGNIQETPELLETK